MCGFIITFTNPLAGLDDHRAMDHALRFMGYRGDLGTCAPGIADYGDVLLGHIRLPIQTSPSEEDGVQPFTLTEKGRPAAFVGELFSYQGSHLPSGECEFLRSHLARTGPSDYDFLHQVDGFWSIALATGSRKFEVLTDHLGIKPVYYSRKYQIAGSEIPAMIEYLRKTRYRSLEFPRDNTHISNCLKWGYDPTGGTPWADFKVLPPGHRLEMHRKSGTTEILPYWNWDNVPPPRSLHMALSAATINRVSLARRDVAGKPALLLSGGLDSTIVYELIRRAWLRGSVRVLSIENPPDEDYLPSNDPDIEILPALESPSPETLRDVVSAMQTPSDLGSLLPQYAMAKRLGAGGLGSRVILTGDGADELFGGYTRSFTYDSQASDMFCELPLYHLPRLDRIHMRFSSEVRSPYLSPAVCKYALGLPHGLRRGKVALKTLAGSLGVPHKVIHRAKNPLKSTAVLQDRLVHTQTLVEAFNAVFFPA